MGEAIKIEVNVRGGKLPVWAREGGQTTLVFLHFWGGSHRSFDQLLARLGDGCRAVSYDHRGSGAARELPGPCGIEELADDALTIVAALGLERYVLVGHSMGGKAALLAASRRPEGLAALALIAPASSRPAVDVETAAGFAHAFDSRDAVGASIEHLLTEHPLPPRLREEVIDDALNSNHDAQLAWPLDGMARDITAVAGAIDVPVVVLAGRQDKVESLENLQSNLLPFIPGARMTILAGTGHLSPLEVPRQIARELELGQPRKRTRLKTQRRQS
jgi:pimeloyl-ACP methyl ester carboxylesterase